MNRAINFLLGATIGGILGATIGILLAPTSGDQLRSEIAKAAADRRAELEGQLAALRSPKQYEQQ